MSTQLRHLLLAGLLFLVSCGGDDEVPPGQPDEPDEPTEPVDNGKWETGTPILTARKEIANATVEWDGKIYVLGGVERSGTISSKLEIYDHEDKTWSAGADLPIALWRATASAFQNKIYLFGGYTSLSPFPFSPVNRVFAYDIATNSWEEKGTMDIARGAATSVSLDSRIHLIGGANNSALSSHAIYDPATDTWEDGPSMSETRSGLTSIVHGSDIYVFGGYQLTSGQVVSKTTVERFSGGAWSSVNAMPVSRLGIEAEVLENTIYVFGGTSTSAFSTMSYDIQTAEWKELRNMPVPVSFMGVARLDTLFFSIGGGPVNLNRTDAVNNNRIFTPPQ